MIVNTNNPVNMVVRNCIFFTLIWRRMSIGIRINIRIRMSRLLTLLTKQLLYTMVI
jgi:hypothetical protein